MARKNDSSLAFFIFIAVPGGLTVVHGTIYRKRILGDENNMKLSKYITSDDLGLVDNKTLLDPEDDVAHVKLGGKWRMPTAEE